MTSHLPLPDEVNGVVWKSISLKTISQVHELIGKIENYDKYTYNTEEYEIKNILNSDYNCCVGAYHGEVLVAYGIIRFKVEEKIVHCFGGVDPFWRENGIGTELLKWYKTVGMYIIRESFLERKSNNNLETISDVLGKVIIEINDDRKELFFTLEQLGFTSTNKFYELRKKLDIKTKPVVLPPFYKIINWEENLEELVRKTNNSLGNQYFNLPELDSIQWNDYMEYANKDWSKILIDKSTDRTKIIGYIISSKYEQDWNILKHKEAYIDLIAVIPKNNQSILMKSMIDSLINTCIENELDCVAIGIEPNKQPELYEILLDMGFEISHSSTEYITQVTSV